MIGELLKEMMSEKGKNEEKQNTRDGSKGIDNK